MKTANRTTPSALFIPLALMLASCSSPAPQRPENGASAKPEPVKILQFYASPGTVSRGEQVNVCYGVENAREVRIEPEIEAIRPALNRCIQFAPRKSAKYTLVAVGRDGGEKRASLEIKVEGRAASSAPTGTAAPPARLITLFAASANQVTRGQPVTLCYEVRDAQTVKLDPGARTLKSSGKECMVVSPAGTTNYKITAISPDGETETQTVTVTVK